MAARLSWGGWTSMSIASNSQHLANLALHLHRQHQNASSIDQIKNRITATDSITRRQAIEQFLVNPPESPIAQHRYYIARLRLRGNEIDDGIDAR